MDIEQVAHENPEAIVTIPVDIGKGLSKETAVQMAEKMGFGKNSQPAAADIFLKLYKLFIEKDATLIEINPLAESSSGKGEHACLDRTRAKHPLASAVHGCQAQL